MVMIVFLMILTSLNDTQATLPGQGKKDWQYRALIWYNKSMSKVVVVKFSSGEKNRFLKPAEYLLLLKEAFVTLAGDEDYSRFLKQLFPGGVIGLKTNCLARMNPTLLPLVDALTDILIDSCGIDENQVVIWERTGDELKRAGYKLNASSFGRRCLGTDTNGIGYGDDFYNSGSVNSLVTGILTRLVDHSINLPVLKDHSLAGMSAGLKNMYGAIHNPNKYHNGNCNPYAADINNLEPIRDKFRLVVIDAVKVQYENGPGFDGRYHDFYNGLIISTDPVAADSIALEVLQYLRHKNNRRTLLEAGRPVKYLEMASKIGLGISDRNLIDLKVITVDPTGRAGSGGLFDG